MLKFMFDEQAGKLKKTPLIIIIFFISVAYVSSVFLNWKNTSDLIKYTELSIENELISISLAAVEVMDIRAFNSYDSIDNIYADQENYDTVLANLRSIQTGVGAEYIYALKLIDGEYQFVFDTDTIDTRVFIPYEIDGVQIEAANGNRSAGVLNIQDEYGTFNTGAVPIYYNGEVIGIMCTDISDHFLLDSYKSAKQNSILFSVVMFVVLGSLCLFLRYLLKKVEQMQSDLQILAHKDSITDLPNRLYLFNYLDHHMKVKPEVPFALMFIDLDNFKTVNDFAGHDAGDEVLNKIADFLREKTDAKTFHPSAGFLNVSCRVGGDEFIQIYNGVKTVEEAHSVAEDLMSSFSPDISRYIEKYNVTFSIGVALYPYHSQNYHIIIKYADIAMYVAKKSGKAQYKIYSEEMASVDINKSEREK